MKDYKWRTSPPLGTEGTNSVYVDSYTASDLFGEGTRTNPYKTLTKAYSAKTTIPTYIICRGYFSEDLTGNHSCEIRGDYLGAATYDGLDTYMLYGFGHQNMIIKNIVPIVAPASHLLAGVGRANYSHDVGGSSFVHGLRGSSALVVRCAAYMGVLGCSNGAANKYIVFASPRCNSSYPIRVSGAGSGNVMSDTFYGCDVSNRAKHASGNHSFVANIFSNFAMIANDSGNDVYECCLFASDCRWYYFAGDTASSTYYELTISGSTSSERQAALLQALEDKYDNLGIVEANRKRPTFTNCIFSSQSSSQLFNNPNKDDFTLIPGCDADTYVSSLLGDAQYIGALPPAINIPIMDDTSGVVGTWDENSVSGCVVVDDDKICIDTESPSAVGEILSKVIQINPFTTQLNGVFATFFSKFANYNAYMNKDSVFSNNEYRVGDTLPVGRYLVTENISYGEESIASGNILVVSEAGTSFSSEVASALAIEIYEPNVMEVVYCRCRSAIYARVGINDSLQAGATYFNDSGYTITYHNRSVINGESFVCMISGERFSCASNSEATIAIMFDDTRVPAVDWCPAQLFGEYFVAKLSGAIRTDAYGIPLSSGNYMSYQTTGLLKSTMDRKYVQFAIKVNRYVTSSD